MSIDIAKLSAAFLDATVRSVGFYLPCNTITGMYIQGWISPRFCHQRFSEFCKSILLHDAGTLFLYQLRPLSPILHPHEFFAVIDDRIEGRNHLTIMVGYDFSAIKPVKVDDHTIRITLPEAQILGDFLETNESKDISLFNRIPDDTVEELKAEARAQAMEDAVNAGIYEMAEEEAKAQIRGLLSEVGDFQIEFM
ncbi:MAG: DUF4230 domain-containing protein [Clostridiales bacterium]|nr:DUF4230 domain-containing protein [Clostridiales bacterium]